MGTFLVYRHSCVRGSSPAQLRVLQGKSPPGKNVVLSISHPEHPSDNRRDDSRLSLSSGLGKSLQIFIRPLGWRWKSAWTATAPAWNDPRRWGGTGTRRLPHLGAVPSRGEEGEAAGRDAGQPLPGGFINLQLERGRAEQQLLIARQIKLTQAAATPGSGSSSARGRDGWMGPRSPRGDSAAGVTVTFPVARGRAIKSGGAEMGAAPDYSPIPPATMRVVFFSKDDHEAKNTAAPVAFNPGSRAIRHSCSASQTAFWDAGTGQGCCQLLLHGFT